MNLEFNPNNIETLDEYAQEFARQRLYETAYNHTRMRDILKKAYKTLIRAIATGEGIVLAEHNVEQWEKNLTFHVENLYSAQNNCHEVGFTGNQVSRIIVQATADYMFDEYGND